MSKNILYRPDLSYEKKYYTEGFIFKDKENSSSNEKPNSQINSDKVDQIKDVIEDIKTKLPFLPNEMLDVFLPPFIVVDDVFKDLVDDEKLDLNDPSVIEQDTDSNHGKDNDKEHNFIGGEIPDDPFGTEDDTFIDVPVVFIPKDKEIDKNYVDDLTDIFKDYLIEYNYTLDKYINNNMLAYSKSNFTEFKYIPTEALIDKNLSHVSDFITKSNVLMQQKLMLYKKQFNIDETIHRIRAVKVSKELLKRYHTNKRLEGKNLLERQANHLLNESRLVYEKKYEENFYSLYKYLNSSVIIFNECVNLNIKQKESLVLLNNLEREK